MARFSVAKYVDAPPSLVFQLFTDLEHAPERVSGISRLDILTPGPVGIGTRFRESRRILGHEATEEMEITAFEPGRHFDVRSRSGGTEYRASYRFSPEGAGTRVEVDFESEPLSLAARLMAPLSRSVTGTMKKYVVQDLDDLRRLAEQQIATA